MSAYVINITGTQ